MQLKPYQLEAHLKKTLLPVYLLSGDEPLLKQEARDNLIQAAQAQGYQAHEKITVEGRFNWEQLTHIQQSRDLFFPKKIIELINLEAKFDAQAAKAISATCAQLNSETVLIIISGKLNSSQTRSSWYQLIDQLGACLSFWPLKQPELLNWIRQRFERINLKADAQAIKLLSELCENNYLAIQQSIEKLRLLYPDHLHINAHELLSVVSDHSRYSIFDFINYVLQGDIQRLLHVLNILQQQGMEPSLMLWALAKEIRSLLEIAEQREQGKNIQSLIEREIFSKRTHLQLALGRITTPLLKTLLMQLTELDQIIKGVKAGDIWLEFSRLSLALAGKQL